MTIKSLKNYSQLLFRSLFFLIVGLFTLGQLERVQLTSTIAFYLHDIVIMGWLGARFVCNVHSHPGFLSDKLKQLHTLFHSHFFVTFITVWIIAGVIIHPSISALLYLARTLLYLAFAGELRRIWKNTSFPLNGWLGAGIGILIFGIIQYIWLPDTRFLYYLGWDDHYYRLISTQFDPGFTGMILIMSLFLLMERAKGINTQIEKIAVLGGELVFIVAIALTYSRSSYLALLAGMGVLFLGKVRTKSPKPWLPVLLSVIFIIIIPFLPRPGGEGVKLERQFSITSRQNSVVSAVNSLKPYQWILGRGLFSTTEQSTQTQHNSAELQNEKQITEQTSLPNTAHFPDNFFVFVLTSTGVVGLAGITWFLIQGGVFLYARNHSALAMWIAVLTHSQFNHTLFQPFVWLFLICVTTLLTSLPAHSVKNKPIDRRTRA